MSGQMVLVCTADLVDNLCPQGAQAWVSASTFDPFAIPNLDQLQSAFSAAITVFFVPTMVVMITALGIRWLHEAIS